MKFAITLVFLLYKITGFAQSNSESKIVEAFIRQFNLKMDTVYWLCEYDDIAWITSDSVYATPKSEQAKLGAEWFCIKDQGIWHALYGKYDNNNFETIYHYVVDINRNIKRTYTKIDTIILNSHARALRNASKLLQAYPDSIKVRFNQYIKKNTDNSLSVWLLPAFTTNGIAVYGGEFYYVFDPTGKSLISKNEYSQGYKGFKPDPKKEIWLDYENVESPTLGSIFFVWYYRRYFDRIVADAKKFKSTLFHDNEKGYYWVHAVKE